MVSREYQEVKQNQVYFICAPDVDHDQASQALETFSSPVPTPSSTPTKQGRSSNLKRMSTPIIDITDDEDSGDSDVESPLKKHKASHQR